MKSRFLKKLLSAALAVTTCAGMVAGMTGCDSGSSDEIKIGLLFSKTGATAITEECMISRCRFSVLWINPLKIYCTYIVLQVVKLAVFCI